MMCCFGLGVASVQCRTTYAYQVDSPLRGRVRTDSYNLIQQHIKRGAKLTRLVQSGMSYASATDAIGRQAESRLLPLQHANSAPTLPLRGNRRDVGGDGGEGPGGGNAGARCNRSSGDGGGNRGEREERAVTLFCSPKAAGGHEGRGPVEEQRMVGGRDPLTAKAIAAPHRAEPTRGAVGNRQSAWPSTSAVMDDAAVSHGGRRSRASQILMERAIANCKPQNSPKASRLQPSQPQLLKPSAPATGFGIGDVALRVVAGEKIRSRVERPDTVSREGFAPIYYRRGATAPSEVSRADIMRFIAQQRRAREGGPTCGVFNSNEQRAEREEDSGCLPISMPQAFRLKVRKCEYLHMKQLHHKKLESAISAFDEERPRTRDFRMVATSTALELPVAQQLAQHALPTMRLQASTIHAEYARLKRAERDKRRGGVSLSTWMHRR